MFMNLHGRSYRHRAYFLRKLGFGSYQAYLKSRLWAEVRERVFAIKGRLCHLCGKPAVQAHHTRYHEADLLGRKLKHIYPVCRQCHRKIEFDGYGNKNSVVRAKKEFVLLMRRRRLRSA